jgi:hypothetical protein
MNSQTFKAQMAVGSWAKTPLYPGFDQMVKIVESQMAGSEQKKQSSQISPDSSDSDDD